MNWKGRFEDLRRLERAEFQRAREARLAERLAKNEEQRRMKRVYKEFRRVCRKVCREFAGTFSRWEYLDKRDDHEFVLYRHLMRRSGGTEWDPHWSQTDSRIILRFPTPETLEVRGEHRGKDRYTDVVKVLETERYSIPVDGLTENELAEAITKVYKEIRAFWNRDKFYWLFPDMKE